MTSRSPYQQLREIEIFIRRLQPDAEAERSAQAAYQQLQKRAVLAVTVMRDYERYEVEEDTKAQLQVLPKGVKSLEQLREAILKASEYDLVGAVDVAQLSVQLDDLIERLR